MYFTIPQTKIEIYHAFYATTLNLNFVFSHIHKMTSVIGIVHISEFRFIKKTCLVADQTILFGKIPMQTDDESYK